MIEFYRLTVKKAMKPENGTALYNVYKIDTITMKGLDSAPSPARRNLPYCKPSIKGNFTRKMNGKCVLVWRPLKH